MARQRANPFFKVEIKRSRSKIARSTGEESRVDSTADAALAKQNASDEATTAWNAGDDLAAQVFGPRATNVPRPAATVATAPKPSASAPAVVSQSEPRPRILPDVTAARSATDLALPDQAAAPTAPVRQRGRPPGSKNKPKAPPAPQQPSWSAEEAEAVARAALARATRLHDAFFGKALKPVEATAPTPTPTPTPPPMPAMSESLEKPSEPPAAPVSRSKGRPRAVPKREPSRSLLTGSETADAVDEVASPPDGRARRPARRGEAALLPRGERWKRRLPRVCR